MPRIRFISCVIALATGLAACGDNETKTTTVTKTTEGGLPTPTQGQPTPAPAPAPAPAEPVANLPEGAVAVQGTFSMTVSSSTVTDNISPPTGEQGEQSSWQAKMRCEPDCVVELRRALPAGGFDTSELKPVDGDPRSFGTTGKVDNYCSSEDGAEGPATKRTSVRVTGVEQRAGQPTATRIQGYFTARQTCEDAPQRATVVYRGALSR